MLTIMKRPSTAPSNQILGQKVKVGKLFLVDLAGSERLKKSRSTGALLMEMPLTSVAGLFRSGDGLWNLRQMTLSY
jgi:hypothetical protein